MSRQRGMTLVELVAATAVLAVIMGITLRLIFLSDRALGAQDTKAAAVASAASLLQDLGRDVRAAAGVSGAGSRLTLSGPQAVTYSSADGQTTRHVSGLPGEDRCYAATFDAEPTGRLVNVTIRSPRVSLQSSIMIRNG